MAIYIGNKAVSKKPYLLNLNKVYLEDVPIWSYEDTTHLYKHTTLSELNLPNDICERVINGEVDIYIYTSIKQ